MATAAKSIILPPNPVDEFVKNVRAQLGDALDGVDVFFNQILIAKWVPKTVGVSGRILSTVQGQKEAAWQGKCGYVLKKGNMAFKDDPDHEFHGVDVAVGDWVLYRYSDGWDIDVIPVGTLDHVQCRVIADVEIKGKISRPDLVW